MLDLHISWLWPDGEGGARGPDGVYRVPGALPGDAVEVRPIRRRGRVRRAELLRIHRPSPDRREPPCPWTQRCGGCDLAALSPTARVAALAAAVQQTLRLGEAPPVFRSPRPRGHRARISLQARAGELGFHVSRGHEIVPVDRCLVARPELQALLERARDWAAAHPRVEARLELRSDGRRCAVDVETAGRPPLDTLHTDVALRGRPVLGEPTLQLQVGALKLRASPTTFYQVNLEVNEALVHWVCQAARAIRAERIIDLYAGLGNLSLPLAAATEAPVVAVERAERAVADCRFSAERLGLPVRAIRSDAQAFDLTREAFDVAVLDPPRAGPGSLLDRVARQRPRRIILLACQQSSVARPLRRLRGYAIREVRLFDMFPDTHHIEVGIILDRS